MKTQTRKDVLKAIKEKNVKFVKIWFTDILGYLKSFTVSPRELDKAFDEGLGFDGSSVEGFVRIDESDMVAIPDPTTFQIVPWHTGDDAVGRMFADIRQPDGSPFEGDPRYILKKNLAEAAKLGYTFYAGPELEFFYFKSKQRPEVLDEGGYFDLLPRDEALDLRRETVRALEAMGIEVEMDHHECAPSQHEIDLRYKDALTMADQVMTYKLTVKEIAQQHDMHASFMPKPLQGHNGSGMHTHMSIFKDGRNLFFDPKDKYHLSAMAKHFIAGLLRHVCAFTAVTNQWVNSYKRLVPGYEAPVYLSWARRNRSDLIRVPMYKPGKENATRVELRSPDPACNPYLAFSVMLAAGLEGVHKKYPAPEPIEENVYEMGPEERKKRGIGSLPGSLIEALQLTEQSELVKRALGAHTFKHFIENKQYEWDRFRIHITNYELNNYLPVL
ncbi:MAG: glutamine synthetase family protein [Planctomycetota bacterium]|nr:glutamine synthetase family protein [Planctomycetota bacterium]